MKDDGEDTFKEARDKPAVDAGALWTRLLTRGRKTRANNHGFPFFVAEARKSKTPAWIFNSLKIAGFVVILALVLAVMAARDASGDAMTGAASILALAACLAQDAFSRRTWEKKVAHQLYKLSDYHDRLVREVARTRADMNTLKEGLANTALSAQQQNQKEGRSVSPEARMIEAIINQLGALGEKPRTSLEPAAQISQILELEMAPPPVRPPPLTNLEKEMNTKLDNFSSMAVLEMIRYAVRNDAIDIFLQPVVNLPQRKPRMYEVFGRIRAGEGVYMPAAHYLEVARREHLAPAIDNLLLLRCLQILRNKAGNDTENIPYMLNITGATLNDRGFMGDLVDFLAEHNAMATRLVFEMTQKDFAELSDAAGSVLDGLSQLGCRFSMDGVRRRQLDVSMLKARHVRFIKIDAAWLIKEGNTPFGTARIGRIKKQLDAAGIDLIVEKIENEKMLKTLLDYNIDFGQGYLFGKPDVNAQKTA